jgi:hypothetical protein
MLACTKCNTQHPETAEFFPVNRRKKNGLDSWCKQCRRDYKRQATFAKGITDFEKAYEARQLAECIICGEPKDSRFAVDHDHETGDVRGGLCMRCNMGIGHFRDDPELLRFAALYLEGRCACGGCSPYWGGAASVAEEQCDAFFPR